MERRTRHKSVRFSVPLTWRFPLLGSSPPYVLLSMILGFNGCLVMPGDVRYPGPKLRPVELNEYYNVGNSYSGFTEELIQQKPEYNLKRIAIDTASGPITVDFYARPVTDDSPPNENLVLVFPILGGKNAIESYFAKYFVMRGVDTAIVHRDKDFKKPEQFDRLEEIFRHNAIRDRIALDFFEKEYHKHKFGSFGISRGAINAAMTAGIDPRLKSNVLALGGSHIVKVFKNSQLAGIRKYRRSVTSANNITNAQFFSTLEKNILTDPKLVAKYIDARHTLMILSVFDTSVPIKYGLKLRREIGRPKTIFLFSGHYTGLLFTQFVKLLPPSEKFCVFPFDFIESEALAFYNKEFGVPHADFVHLPFVLVQLPMDIIGTIYYSIFGTRAQAPSSTPEHLVFPKITEVVAGGSDLNAQHAGRF